MVRTVSRVALFACLSAACLAQSVGVGGGGAFFGPSINPANENEAYVSSDMSELFHTTDYGRSWDVVPFTRFQGGGFGIVRFTSNPSILYGLATINDVPTLVKTTDGGTTWNALASNPAGDTYSLYVQYDNSNRLIIADYSTMYVSNDGGGTFTTGHTAATGQGIHVGGVFFDGSNVYAGTNDGLLVSTNGGASFSNGTMTGIPAGNVIASFAGAKVGATTRFFCLTAASASVWGGVQPYFDYVGFMTGVYAVDYGAASWTSRMTGITVGTDYPLYVAMAENNIATAYLGGSNSSGEPDILRMTNAGTTWTWTRQFNTASNANIVTGWSGTGGDRGWGYGEVTFSLIAARNNASKLMFTDYGFIHVSTDGGTTWRQSYLSAADENPAGSNTPKNKAYHGIGAEDTTCWQVMWVDANNVWAAFSDIHGVRSTDGGASWSFNYVVPTLSNTVYRIVRHPTTGVMYAATSSIHDMYQSTRLQDNPLDNADGEGKILMSTNNGANWTLMHNFGHPVFWLALDPNNGTRMYASVIHSTVGGVFISNDINLGASSTWTKLANPPRTQGHPASLNVLNDGTLLATYSGRRDAAGAFTASSGTFIYSGGAWTDRSASGMQYWTKDAVVYPYDATQNTWYVGVFSGWGGPPNGLGGLYRTTNRGVSWTRIWSAANAAAADRVTSITFSPLSSTEAYVTTETGGLWNSTNITAATPTLSLVASYPFRQPERVFYNPFDTSKIWVTSFGHGMRILTGACGPLGPIGNTVGVNKTGGMTITWPDVVGESAYDIYEASTPSAPFPTGWTVAFTAPANSTSWTTTLGTGNRYFRVRSRDACGNVQD